MFGREPRLPIDFVLGVEAGEEGEVSVEEWVKEHQELFEGAYDHVRWRLESRRQLRDQSYESKVTDTGIEEVWRGGHGSAKSAAGERLRRQR